MPTGKLESFCRFLDVIENLAFQLFLKAVNAEFWIQIEESFCNYLILLSNLFSIKSVPTNFRAY